MARVVPANWPAIRFAVFKRDAFTCQSCMKIPGPDGWLEADHVIPYTHRGSDALENLITLCNGCNYSKGDKFGPPGRLLRESDRDGFRTWKSWGAWELQFTDENAVLVHAPGRNVYGGDYWIAYERVHDHDWEEHVRSKPWARTDRYTHPIRATAEIELSRERDARLDLTSPYRQRNGFDAADVTDDPRQERLPVVEAAPAFMRPVSHYVADIVIDAAEIHRREPWIKTVNEFMEWSRPAGRVYYDFVDAIAFCRLLSLSRSEQLERKAKSDARAH